MNAAGETPYPLCQMPSVQKAPELVKQPDPTRKSEPMSKRALPIAKLYSRCCAVLLATFVSGTSAASAEDLQKVSVRMDWVVSAYHAPFYAGVKNGFFKEQGLDVTVQPGNGSANVAQAIGHGNGEFASVDGGTMMQLVAKGLPVKCVMGYYQRNPNGVIYTEKSGIKKPTDLEGKTLALSNGDAPSALLPAFAKATGLDLSKVNIVNTSPAAKNATVISGKADADVTFAFQGVPIIRAGGVPADSFDYADYGVNVPGLCVIAEVDYIKQHPDIVKKFVAGAQKAIGWSKDHPQEAIDILTEMNQNTDVDTKTALPILVAGFKLLHTKNTQDKPIGVMARQDWADAENLLAQYVGLKKADSPDEYFTNEFITVP
jgi:NitT/TauT family transport system substrate-binding protein